MDSKKKPEALTNEELATVSGGLRRRYVEPTADGLTFKFGSMNKFASIQYKYAPLYDVSSNKLL